MGDSNSSSTWSDDENGHAGHADSNLEDGSWSSYQNVPPEDGHLGGHNKENDPESAYSKNTSEVIASTENDDEHHGQPDIDVVPDEEKKQLVDMYRKVMAMTFDSELASFVWYNSYAKEHGFSIRKGKMKRRKGPLGEIRFRRYLCSRAGKRQEKYLTMEGRIRKPRRETRCECKAHLDVKRDISHGVWVVGRFDDNHNHNLARPDEFLFLRSHRKKMGFQEDETLSMGASGTSKIIITTTFTNKHGKYDDTHKQNTKVSEEENHPVTKNGRPLAFHGRGNRHVCGACNIPGHNRRNKKLCKLHPLNMVQEEK